tara:strand:+ start:507 stop:767 length:261 start_codon:yes stop_codon:yes gene_type:complete
MNEINALKIILMLDPTARVYAPSTKYEDLWWETPVTVTKEQFDAGVLAYPAWLAEKEAAVKQKRLDALSKLEALGLTADDLKALGL